MYKILYIINFFISVILYLGLDLFQKYMYGGRVGVTSNFVGLFEEKANKIKWVVVWSKQIPPPYSYFWNSPSIKFSHAY